MKKFNSLFLVLIIGLVALAGCKKENIEVTPPTEEEIVAGTWRVESVEVFENGQKVTEGVNYLENMTFRFDEDGTYEVSLESNAFPQSTGTWGWESQTVKRNIVLDQGTATEVLLEVTKMEQDDFDFSFTRPEQEVAGGRVQTIPETTYYFQLRSL